MFPSNALKLRDELARGERSSREVTEHYLKRIEEQADLGAFVHVAENAMEAAAAADGFRTLRTAAAEQVAAGVTTIAEVLTVLPPPD